MSFYLNAKKFTISACMLTNQSVGMRSNSIQQSLGSIEEKSAPITFFTLKRHNESKKFCQRYDSLLCSVILLNELFRNISMPVAMDSKNLN